MGIYNSRPAAQTYILTAFFVPFFLKICKTHISLSLLVNLQPLPSIPIVLKNNNLHYLFLISSSILSSFFLYYILQVDLKNTFLFVSSQLNKSRAGTHQLDPPPPSFISAANPHHLSFRHLDLTFRHCAAVYDIPPYCCKFFSLSYEILGFS